MFRFQYFKIPRTLSRDYCSRALQALETVIHSTNSGGTRKPQHGVIHLIVIPSEEMARMNLQFRGKEGPTDILTFSYLKPHPGPLSLEGEGKGMGVLGGGFVGKEGLDVAGEIYLCLEKIKSYAKDAGITYKEQLEYIIIHGLVHLMGYDHETDADWREMEKVEKKIQSLLK